MSAEAVRASSRTARAERRPRNNKLRHQEVKLVGRLPFLNGSVSDSLPSMLSSSALVSEWAASQLRQSTVNSSEANEQRETVRRGEQPAPMGTWPVPEAKPA